MVSPPRREYIPYIKVKIAIEIFTHLIIFSLAIELKGNFMRVEKITIPMTTPIVNIVNPKNILRKLENPKVKVNNKSNSSFEANPCRIPIPEIAA